MNRKPRSCVQVPGKTSSQRAEACGRPAASWSLPVLLALTMVLSAPAVPEANEHNGDADRSYSASSERPDESANDSEMEGHSSGKHPDGEYAQHHRALKEQVAPLSQPDDHDSVQPHAH